MHKESDIRQPLILGNKTYSQITKDVVAPVFGKANKQFKIVYTLSILIALWGIGCIAYTIGTGIGVWGLNNTVDWAWDITNFVWWVGIGHAGTLISAVLLLFRQKWRMAINRSAEAMTIFAVMMAAIFPLLHMGRIWMLPWAFPPFLLLPNTFGSLWPNFNSPLLWDIFAISTYFTVSLVFWYIGLIPDFATIRDKAVKPFAQKAYKILSFGWTGDAKAWIRFEEISLVLAGLATPLVFSVHSIVSMDFATSVIPGWHTTIFPPYFVAGAIFSGFAMVETLMIIVRKVLSFEDYITIKHIEYMNIIIVVTGSMVGVAYLSELFISWYSGVEYEGYAFLNRATGPYWWAYLSMMTCNVITPQLYWFKKIRTNLVATFILSIVVNIGMWFERFVIIVTSLHRDYLPSSWDMFHPTWVDMGVYIGTIGIFFTLFLTYSRFFPVLPLNELKSILKSTGENYKLVAADHSIKHVHTESPSVQHASHLVGNSTSAQLDDLTKVEGIGPKIAEILNADGIYTFEQLSKTSIEKLSSLLEQAGPRFKMHHPGTWPKQAEMAAKGDWQELQKYQDELNGGFEQSNDQQA